MTGNNDDAVRAAVREHYASAAVPIAPNVAASEPRDACCAPTCCAGESSASLKMGTALRTLRTCLKVPIWGLGAGTRRLWLRFLQEKRFSTSALVPASIAFLPRVAWDQAVALLAST